MRMLRNSFVVMLVAVLLLSQAVSAQTEQKRKRWTPQAKGYAIGVGTGAAAGALIHKRNRVAGGAVGAVAGAAAGYAIGKHIDNKNKEKARIAAAQRAAENREFEQRELASGNKPAVMTQRSATAPAAAMASKKAGFSAVAPANTFTGEMTPAAFARNTGYLLNPTYGDPDAPYGMSEYRRKSW